MYHCRPNSGPCLVVIQPQEAAMPMAIASSRARLDWTYRVPFQAVVSTFLTARSVGVRPALTGAVLAVERDAEVVVSARRLGSLREDRTDLIF